ncbi:MAG: sulfite exporter TauE/SafE family protein [Bdellovibrionaceae bacterium]|nr:sulfite exporter TauE/SafE family protein [Pseudobdellovibrionaceae bacterium]
MEIGIPTILALAASGALAGLLGAVLGIGGGIVIVPTLVLLFGFDIKIAVACSLVSVVASSTSASSVYVGKGLANMRLGMLLEVATTLGGIAGGFLALILSPNLLSGIFGVVMIGIAIVTFRKTESSASIPAAAVEGAPSAPEDSPGYLSGTYYDAYRKSLIHYKVWNIPFGGLISFVAGVLSGLLGVGGGFMKVPAMNIAMGVPIKVAAATSNFMIGVTAISSLFVYFAKGFVYPLVAAPVALGVVGGALVGTSVAQKISPWILKKIFAVVLVVIALQMVLKAWGGFHG